MNGPRLDVEYGAFWGLEKYIMSRRFTRLSLWLVFLLSSEVWAIGLGDIELDSALNEPLRAEIVLLSATADELADLTVTLASAETFTRYGIDRPFYLQGIEFNVVDGGAAGSVVQVRSRAPITEPFLTFLVEATWSSGRLLREYTVLLDPPTYAPPTVQQAAPVEAPRRSTPSDSGRIERQVTPTPEPARPAPQPVQPARSSDTSDTSDSSASDTSSTVTTETRPEPVVDDTPYSSSDGGDFVVSKGQTLWGVAAHLRPDSRLTMNQTMLAIFEANPEAFGGNINVLRAGARLRIPSADEVFQISRTDALSEVQRQHSSWGGGTGYTAPEPSTRPSLTLVPPDEEPAGSEYDETSTYEPQSREQQIENRITELEGADVPNQQSLIEIRDNELANLRQELANIRGEVYEPPVTDTVDDTIVDDAFTDDSMADDPLADDLVGDDSVVDDPIVDTVEDDLLADDAEAVDDVAASDVVTDTTTSTDVVTTSSSRDKSIVDQAIEFLTGFWGIIIAALVLVAGGLLWFIRRGDDDDDDVNDRPWETLDSDEMAAGTMSATATIQAPTPEEAIVVVEQDSGVHPILEDTVEAPAADFAEGEDQQSGSFGSLEDTFSSETAVNLDQTDPVAEADFHMAYGLYDQAADLINGALETDPTDKSLMSKLCEIYFVWGNRDAFVDAASRLHSAVGDGDSGDWDKIVIMGQQIAADHDLFAGAELAGATKAVDLSFDDEGEAAGELDMDFGADDSGASDVIDLGADFSDDSEETQEGVDFNFDEPENDGEGEVDFDLEVTAQTPTLDASLTEATAEMPAPTVETPTIEEQFAGFDEGSSGTSELPSLDESLHESIADSGQDTDDDATAEINLDELDLDVEGISDTEVASLDDLDATGRNETLSDTGIDEALADLDLTDVTGKNPEIDPDSTGIREGFDIDATGLVEGLDLSDLDDSGMRLAADETGQNPLVSAESEQESTDIDIDDGLLDATGLTQVLSDDMAVETGVGVDVQLSDADATMLAPDGGDDDVTIESLPEDAETMLAPMDDDDDDFDFAKTEALPPEAFTGNMDLEATAETPAIAGTDVNLDLDDLTAALQVSEIGDTIEQPRDDATVEQPRPTMPEATAEVPTMSLAAEELSGDLHEARTMTEVGTKLDLARAYVDMGDPAGARSILEEVLDEGDDGQKQQAQQLLDSLPS
jgi:pilus assembly protein FimV